MQFLDDCDGEQRNERHLFQFLLTFRRFNFAHRRRADVARRAARLVENRNHDAELHDDDQERAEKHSRKNNDVRGRAGDDANERDQHRAENRRQNARAPRGAEDASQRLAPLRLTR